jgi:D-sedoheptulose 7-phosphate isomerase
MTQGVFARHFAAHQMVVRQSVVELEGASDAVASAIVAALRQGGKVLAFGNGGSATQASHLAGELIGRFAATRRPLAAIALVADPGSVTCIANDFGYGMLFERQVEGLARTGDIAIGLTTSGRSENVVRGLAAARRAGAVTVALTGEAGLSGEPATHILRVPSASTAAIQEVHLMLLHTWCVSIDEAFA